MKNLDFSPGTMLAPVPVIMATCGTAAGRKNIITIAWTGIVNTDPPMTYISVREDRCSYRLICENRTFAINLVTEELVWAADWCGVRSGREYDKFRETGLHWITAKTGVPLLEESPLRLECCVRQDIPLGTHHMFLAEIVNVSVQETLLDETGRLRAGSCGSGCMESWRVFPPAEDAAGKIRLFCYERKNQKAYAQADCRTPQADCRTPQTDCRTPQADCGLSEEQEREKRCAGSLVTLPV